MKTTWISSLAMALVLAAGPASAQNAAPGPNRHPPTIDDIMKLRMVTGLSANPAGPGAIAMVTEYDGGKRFLRDLWLVVPGGQPRRLTTGGKGGGSFAWSPDGKRVAFVGERNGKSGIQVLPLDGGEADTLLELPVDADALRWVGDDLWFSAPVHPECGADFACTKQKQADREAGTSAKVYTELYFRPWNAWREPLRNGLFRLDTKTGKVSPVAMGDFDVPPAPFGGVEDYTVSRDGKTVIYTAKKVPGLATSTNLDLFEATGGAEKKVSESPGADRAPVFSPDGNRVAWLSQATDGFESDWVRAMVWDRTTGERFQVAAELDNWVEELVWAPDSQSLVLVVEEQGHRLLYRAEAKKGAAAKRIAGRALNRHVSVGGDGRLYYTRETMTQPPDVFAIDLKAKNPTEERLTAFNDAALATLVLPKVEEVWYDGAKILESGRQRVHAFVVRPGDAEPGKKLPLVVMIHGGPQGAWLDGFHPRWNALPIAAQGFVVVLPNITGSTGYGQAFVNAVSKDWGGRPFEDVMALLDAAAKWSDVDASRACAMGGSYGGYMTNWLEGHTDRFKCLVSHAGPSSLASKYGSTDELWFPEWDIGGTPWDTPDAYAKASPYTYAKAFKTPMLVIHGANDFRVPLEQGLIMFTTLRRLGVEAKLVVFPDEDHFVSKPINRRFWYQTVIEWLKAHL